MEEGALLPLAVFNKIAVVVLRLTGAVNCRRTACCSPTPRCTTFNSRPLMVADERVKFSGACGGSTGSGELFLLQLQSTAKKMKKMYDRIKIGKRLPGAASYKKIEN